MAKTNFTTGTIVSSAFLNSLQSLAFDTEPGNDLYDGHYLRLTDDALSNDPASLKSQFYTANTAFKVTAGTGLNVNYNGGTAVLADGITSMAVVAGTLTLPSNSTNYIFLSASGAVSTSTILPVRCVPLAIATTNVSGLASAIVDIRSRFRVSAVPSAIPVFGSVGYEGDMVCTNGQVLGGQISVRNFTVGAGITVTVPSGYLQILASGTVTINGTINVAATIPGGRGFSGTVTNLQWLADSGSGYGGAGGHNSTPSPVYSYFVSPTGSGGAAGFVSIQAPTFLNSVGLTSSRGGAGGGAFICDAAGSINLIGATINCSGTSGMIGTIASNGNATAIVLGGGGGGTGGCIWLKSLVSIIGNSGTTTLNVTGGAGAAGFDFGYTPNSALGGGGGGGGYVATYSPNTNLTGANVLLTGGAGGARSNTGTSGIAGSNGGSFGGVGGTGGSNGVAATAGSIGQLVQKAYVAV